MVVKFSFKKKILNAGHQHENDASYEARKAERNAWNQQLCSQLSILDKKKSDLLERRMAVVRSVLEEAEQHELNIEDAMDIASSAIVNSTELDEEAVKDAQSRYG